MPERIRRRRTAGWRMPEGAVYVGRPGRWGNDFSVKGYGCTPESAVALFRDMLARAPRDPDGSTQYEVIRRELAGRDLVCWCPLDQPCHADVLLEIANGPSEQDRVEIAAEVHAERTADAATWLEENQ